MAVAGNPPRCRGTGDGGLGVADPPKVLIDHQGDLFGELYLAENGDAGVRRPAGSLLPGLVVTFAASGAAAWLSEHYGFPIILMGLLVGLSLNFVSRDVAVHRGLDFAGQTFLRFGIVALGLQVTLDQARELGFQSLLALIAIMAVTFASGIAAARLAGQSRYAGILAGGATAICGASAALALYGVIGQKRLPQAQFALTLVGVSLASALAMSLYPVIAAEIGLDEQQAGFLIGASVHDVAQAIGGGYAHSDLAGGQATIVKLSRVALLAPVVMLVSLWLGAADDARARLSLKNLRLPWFITAFAILVIVNSSFALPERVGDISLAGSKGLLLLAVTATAMRSRFDLIRALGWKAGMPILAASLTSFLASLAFVLLIGV